jgi:hypothetical protein
LAYYLSLSSPETYEAFCDSDRAVTGFRERHRNAASKLQLGDKLIDYVTGVSRWWGIAEITSASFRDDTPRYQTVNDPYVIRFNINQRVCLPLEKAIPIHDDRLWNHLSFTKQFPKNSKQWTGKIRTSLVRLDDADGRLLEDMLLAQAGENAEIFPLDKEAYSRMKLPTVSGVDGPIAVVVPEEPAEEEAELEKPEARESIKVQAQLAKIGAEMGMQVWIPRNDRAAVLKESPECEQSMLSMLPLNYNEATIKTVEQIDVLWIRKKTIVRVFEVEHTTSIYSGILRMADLMALQPNLNIKAHIVAPAERREKVKQEIRRPVFSLLEKGPLAESCTYLSYDSVKELADQKLLAHLSDGVLDDFAEYAEEEG